MLESILALDNTRNEAGSSICNHASCSGVAGKVDEVSSVSGQGGTPGTPKNNDQEAKNNEDVEKGWSKVGSRKKNKKK